MSSHIFRFLNTRWLVDWLRRDEMKDCLEEIRFLRGIPSIDRQTAIRMTVLQHLGVLPLPEGPRMEFVVHAIECLFRSIDWARVEEELFRD